jgi:hypothetical protein
MTAYGLVHLTKISMLCIFCGSNEKIVSMLAALQGAGQL